MEQKYAAFISYRHMELDSAVAKALHSHIEQYVIPRELRKNGKKLGRVFRDVEELPVSSDLSEDICRALDNSEYLVVVCSPAAVESQWVLREVSYFLTHHDRQNVFTVLVAGEPGAAFPPMLTRVENPDGTVTDVEPLAVDVRAESPAASVKRLRREIPRLFAAMIGCPYDALVMREQRRARRRIISAAAGILAVALAFTSLVLVKNHQIDGKNEELEARNAEIDRQNEELEAQNEELERQKREVQLRESALLTAEAETALAEGNRGAALTNALAALTSEDGDRPYYAPAEAALISALGIFEGGLESLVVETRLEQNTPVVDFCANSDGSRLAVADEYGMITCFDTKSGETVWTAVRSNTKQLKFCGGDRLLALGSGGAGLSFETGETVWQWSGDRATTTTLTVSSDSSLAAFLVSRLSDDLTTDRLSLVVLNTADGTVQHEILVGEYAFGLTSDSYPLATFPEEYFGNDGISATSFSGDLSKIAGVYFEEPGKDELVMHVYTVDLETETLTVHITEPVSSQTMYHAQLCDEDRSLLVLRYVAENGTPGMLEKYDLEENRLVWQTEYENEALRSTWYTAPRYCAEKDGLILVGCEALLAAFDTESGEIIDSYTYEAKICALEIPEYPFFRVATQNGDYSYGFLNAYDSLIPNIASHLGACSQAWFWNGGYLELERSEGRVEGVTFGNEGYVVTLPEENGHFVAVKRAVVPGEAFSIQQEAFLGEDDSAGSAAMWMCGERMILGPISDYSNDAFPTKILVMDPEDPENPVVMHCPEDYLRPEYLQILPDLSGFICCRDSGDIVLYDTEGSGTVLSRRETVDIGGDGENYLFVADRYAASGAVRDMDGTVITARICEEELVLWENGEELPPVAAPEGTTFQMLNNYGVQDLLMVCENGKLVTALFEKDSDEMPDALGIYDTVTGTWKQFTPERVDLANFHAVMDSGSHILLADAEGTAFLCDGNTGAVKSTFSMYLPFESISQLHLMEDDAFLLAVTEDSHFWIYDTATGEVVYREQMQTYDIYNNLTIVREQDGTRLYISWEDGGIVLEMDGWTKLAASPDIIGYDPYRDTIVSRIYDTWTWTDVLQFLQLPDTEGLVEIARGLLVQP